MSSSIHNEENNSAAKLNMRPVRSILKTSKSLDHSQIDSNDNMTNYPSTGMTRSESKSQKIPHFDEMNIIATYHPIDKDYGHMKIDEPKTPYSAEGNIDEEMETEEVTLPGVDPDALAQKLFETSGSFHISRRSIDETTVRTPENEEHRKEFETHRKRHYNEFEMAQLHKKEIEDELRALEQEENLTSNDSIKPILIHDHSSPRHRDHHVQVAADDPTLSPEEQERRKQFELKRKQHYNEFLVAHSTNKEDNV